MNARDFVALLKPEALAVATRTGIPPGFLIAHAARESNWMEAVPADLITGRPSHNLFGLPAAPGRPFVRTHRWQHRHGRWRKALRRLAFYSDWRSGLAEFAELLVQPPYAEALSLAGDAAAYARAVYRAGLADDPQQADAVARILRHPDIASLGLAPPPGGPGTQGPTGQREVDRFPRPPANAGDPHVAVKIRGVTVDAAVAQATAIEEKVVIQATAQIQVLYVAGDGIVRPATACQPFSEFVPVPGASEGMPASATVLTEFQQGRIGAGGRRIRVTAILSLQATAGPWVGDRQKLLTIALPVS